MLVGFFGIEKVRNMVGFMQFGVVVIVLDYVMFVVLDFVFGFLSIKYFFFIGMWVLFYCVYLYCRVLCVQIESGLYFYN